MLMSGRVYANEWEGHSSYFGGGAETSRIWATAHSLVLYQCLATVVTPLSVISLAD